MWTGKEIGSISFHRGGIHRRLLVWNLSVFGLVLLGIVLASYLYSQRLVKKDSFELQAELAPLLAARIDSFVDQKIERLRDAAVAMSLYPPGSKEQELLATLMLKRVAVFTDASILNSKGMEVVKVSERTAYTLTERYDQSRSEK